MNVYLRIKKVDDEWQVVWIEDGKRNEDKTYYTDDIDDAVNTALHIAGRHNITDIRATGKALKMLRAQMTEPF